MFAHVKGENKLYIQFRFNFRIDEMLQPKEQEVQWAQIYGLCLILIALIFNIIVLILIYCKIMKYLALRHK